MIRKVLVVTVCGILLSGCVSSSTKQTVPKSTKVVGQQIKDTKLLEQNKQKYKKCEEHKKVMNYAFLYVADEFRSGYFVQKDIVGAKAQLFLIQSQSQSVFAKNINDAEKSYAKHYALAKKLKCDLKNFSISPVTKIKNIIEILDDEQSL